MKKVKDMALVLDKRLILCCCAFSIISVANAATVNGTFQVLMTIQKACTVTAGSASNITLGPVNTTATNTSASNTISINCSKTTPYFIGLAPSAANGGTTTGSGAMSSVANAATNTDKVPYQLNRTSATGPVWGIPPPTPHQKWGSGDGYRSGANVYCLCHRTERQLHS